MKQDLSAYFASLCYCLQVFDVLFLERFSDQWYSLVDLTKRSANQMRRFRVVMLTLVSHIIRSIKVSLKAEDPDVERPDVEK